MGGRHRQLGFGLIEIMVALALGMILIGALIQVFSSSRLGYQMEAGMSRLQENGRLAMDLVKFDTRMGGYLGCGSIDQVDPVERNASAITFDPANAVRGHQHTGSTWSPALPAALSGLTSPPLAGTDVVTVQKGESCGAYLTGNMTAATANIPIDGSNSCSIAAQDLLLITDCTNGDLFVATGISGTAPQSVTHTTTGGFNTSNIFTRAYGPEAEVLTFESISYYVAAGAGGGSSLWRFYQDRATGGNNPQELVEGVENLQLLFGEDTDGDRYAETYVVASSVGDWSAVVSVRMAMLINSVENAGLTLDTATYNLLGVTVDPTDDRLLRKVFRGTVSQRNRLP